MMDKSKINKLINSGLSPKQACSVANFIEKEIDNFNDECVEKGFITGLAVVLQLVISDIWGSEAREKAPDFVRECMDLYSEICSGLLTFDEVTEYIYTNSGVKIDLNKVVLAGEKSAEMVKFE